MAMAFNRLIGAPLIIRGLQLPRFIRVVYANINNNNNLIDANIAINIANINNNNNNEDATDPTLLRMRTRLFRVLFMKIALVYAIAIPLTARKAIEWLILLSAFASLFVLCHLHVNFIRTPIKCLEHVQHDWPRDGILRVQIVHDPHHYRDETTSAADVSSLDVTAADEEAINALMAGDLSIDGSNDDSEQSESAVTNTDNSNTVRSMRSAYLRPVIGDDSVYYSNWSSEYEYKDSSDDVVNDQNGYPQPLREKVSHLQMIASAVWPHDSYIVEYSLEYGFLRMSARARHRLQIPVKVVTLDPSRNACFGDVLSRALLHNFLGYDDILMGSVKNLAEKENNKGYVRNVITGEHYRFVNVWMTRASYIAAAFIMLVFTLSISMLLRYSHHQVFIFVCELMHMIESNVHFTYNTFPAAPLLTVILALVGMEAIMSEFFNDTTTAFYVILMVWIADQYDAMCCHTAITKRHWLKFFYLYHFAFYAYDYRFNGQYSGLALLTSWLFTQHSMVYFFHHYELPYMLSQTIANRITIQTTIRTVNDDTRDDTQPPPPPTPPPGPSSSPPAPPQPEMPATPPQDEYNGVEFMSSNVSEDVYSDGSGSGSGSNNNNSSNANELSFDQSLDELQSRGSSNDSYDSFVDRIAAISGDEDSNKSRNCCANNNVTFTDCIMGYNSDVNANNNTILRPTLLCAAH